MWASFPVSVRQRQDTLELDDTTESIDTIPEEAQEDLDDGEIALLAHLTGAPAHVDDLCRQSGIPIASITSMLTLLELKGKVTQVGSMHYIRASAVEVTHGS